MLIKSSDDQSNLLAALEVQAQSGGVAGKRAEQELRSRRAGIRAEQEAAYLIDFDFAASANWAVIHDLRLEHAGRVAQIDHLLINRWMDIYVLETKAFHAGVKITEDGEFLRWNDYRKTYEGMASPLQQNERHIQVLRDVVTQIELPTRLGLRISPSFQTFVLVSPKARIDRPKAFDSSRVIKSDQLKTSIWRDIDNENGLLGLLKTAAKIVSSDTVEFVAKQLAALHRPLRTCPSVPASGAEDVPAVVSATAPLRSPTGQGTAAPPQTTVGPDGANVAQASAPPGAAGAQCKACCSSRGTILSGRYGYYFKCQDCETNTAIRFTCQPGHKPRLRGERGTFYRECEQCGTSDWFFANSLDSQAKQT